MAEDIHGNTGMEIHNYELPEPTVAVEDTDAVDFIIDTVMNNEPGTVALVPTGPLTNIALAVRKEPRIAERVKEVVLMGGGYHVGNWTAVAEFNIKIDPEAAPIAFNESWPLTMAGLDLTRQALATAEIEAKLSALGAGVVDFLVALSTPSARTTRRPRASTTCRSTTPAPWPASPTRPCSPPGRLRWTLSCPAC